MATAEGAVAGLTIEVARAKARIDAALSAGVDTTKAKRTLARLESELETAKRQAAVELHALPRVADLTLQVEQLQSDLAAAQSTIERLRAAPVA
ncbi:putative nucleic acid-binding Zn-ribbon protein [Burkholderia ambifaria]|nr:hypothetical protein [Burkholderia ambifaria]MDR6503563.1 putative nucleic acid-binding Zn-ribbon protein [Burkholderia ambifaria]